MMMYGETFYGRHTAQHQKSFKVFTIFGHSCRGLNHTDFGERTLVVYTYCLGDWASVSSKIEIKELF